MTVEVDLVECGLLENQKVCLEVRCNGVPKLDSIKLLLVLVSSRNDWEGSGEVDGGGHDAGMIQKM